MINSKNQYLLKNNSEAKLNFYSRHTQVWTAHLLTFEKTCYEWTLIRRIKALSRPVIPVDYKQKSRSDQNTKKLDKKVRQPDETSLIKTTLLIRKTKDHRIKARVINS